MPGSSFATILATHPGLSAAFAGGVVALILWSIIWKGAALWLSARNHQKVWFVLLLVLNTAGILEIIYILFFRKNKNNTVTTTTVTHTTVAASPAPEAAAPATDGSVMMPVAPTAPTE